MSLCPHLVRYNVLKAAPRAGQSHFWPQAVLCPFPGLDPQSPSSRPGAPLVPFPGSSTFTWPQAKQQQLCWGTRCLSLLFPHFRVESRGVSTQIQARRGCFPAALPMSKPILCPCCSAGCWMVQMGKQEQGISPLMAVRDPGAVPTPGGTPCPFPAALSHCLSLEQQNSPAPHSVPSPRSSSPVPGTSFPILALPPGSRSQKRPKPLAQAGRGRKAGRRLGLGSWQQLLPHGQWGAADGGFRFSGVRNGSLQVPVERAGLPPA